MAVRGELEDKDYQLDLVDGLLYAIDNAGRGMGAKITKRKPHPKLLPNKKYNPDEIPTLEQAMNALTSAGTIVEKD